MTPSEKNNSISVERYDEKINLELNGTNLKKWLFIDEIFFLKFLIVSILIDISEIFRMTPSEKINSISVESYDEKTNLELNGTNLKNDFL